MKFNKLQNIIEEETFFKLYDKMIYKELQYLHTKNNETLVMFDINGKRYESEGSYDEVIVPKERMNDTLFLLHNHPTVDSFSPDDITCFLSIKTCQKSSLICKNGDIYHIETTNNTPKFQNSNSFKERIIEIFNTLLDVKLEYYINLYKQHILNEDELTIKVFNSANIMIAKHYKYKFWKGN
jgi:hypothetical protein